LVYSDVYHEVHVYNSGLGEGELPSS